MSVHSESESYSSDEDDSRSERSSFFLLDDVFLKNGVSLSSSELLLLFYCNRLTSELLGSRLDLLLGLEDFSGVFELDFSSVKLLMD